MKLRTHALTALMVLPAAVVALASIQPLNPRLDAYRTHAAAKADVLTAKNALGREIVAGSGRVKAARRLYKARNAAWKLVMAAPDSIPAFPGATGGGATAFNACRSLPLKVWKVRDLSTGTSVGSIRAILRDSVSSTNFDIIIGDTAGTIGSLTSGTRFRDLDTKGCVYFAGQTFKGGLQLITGLGVGGVMIGSSHPTGGSSDLVWRYTHARCTILDTTPRRTNQCVGIDHRNSVPTGGNNIWDHMSITGGNDQLLSHTDAQRGRFRSATMSYNLLYGVPAHNQGSVIMNAGNPFPLPTPSTTSCNGLGGSMFRNVSSSTGHRNPNTGGGPVCAEVINNYIYNWESRNTNVVDSTMIDWTHNYIDNTVTAGAFPVMTQSVFIWVDITFDNITDCKPGGSREADNCIGIFVEKNLWVSGGTVGSKTVLVDTTADQWETVCDNRDGDVVNAQACDDVGVDSVYFRRHVRLVGTPKWPVAIVQATAVPSLLIGTGTNYSADSVRVGANGWIGCSGASLEVGTGALTGAGFTRLIDGFDQNAVEDIFTNFNRTYVNILEDYAVGGVMPTFTAASPRCADADNDGMPDAWENSFGNVNAGIADADTDLDEDGWLAMEEYVNGSDPDLFTAADGTESGGAPAPTPTYGATRFVYYDTLVQYTEGSLVRLLPDTSDYGVAVADVEFGVVFKTRVGAAEGDPVLIFADDSITGTAATQLDSAAATDTVGVWALPGFTEDSLKTWAVP